MQYCISNNNNTNHKNINNTNNDSDNEDNDDKEKDKDKDNDNDRCSLFQWAFVSGSSLRVLSTGVSKKQKNKKPNHEKAKTKQTHNKN